MNGRRFSLCLAIALAVIVSAVAPCGQSLYGDDRSPGAAQSQAEIERKIRENKKRGEDHRKQVEAHQRQVRQRLNLPDPASGGHGTPPAKTNGVRLAPSPVSPTQLPPSRLPGPGAQRKNWNLPDPRDFARSRPSGIKKSSVEYAPQRGQKFAFLVEMSTQEGALQKQWIGTPYFVGIYSDVGRSFAEMLCIGNLACRIRSSPDHPWSPVSIEDIELPQRFMFEACRVLYTQTKGLLDQHTLPLQLSAILPLEELIFPALPMFSDSSRNESTERTTFYLRGGQKNFFGETSTTTLDGEFRRKCVIEQENSATPQIVNERAFHCSRPDVGLSFRQVASIDAKDGMIVSVDLDYLLELGEDVRLTVKVRRLTGNDLETARADALKQMPPTNWPSYFQRIPADSDAFGPHLSRSAEDIPGGQPISVSIDINERSAHGARDYLARAIAGAPHGQIRVRLEGSDEELDVSHSDVRLPK